MSAIGPLSRLGARVQPVFGQGSGSVRGRVGVLPRLRRGPRCQRLGDVGGVALVASTGSHTQAASRSGRWQGANDGDSPEGYGACPDRFVMRVARF